MRREIFYFDLPNRLIAQKLIPHPEQSRLLVLLRKENRILHRYFKDLPNYLDKGDLLVLNNTMVVPSRMWGILDRGGQVEVTLVTRRENNIWDAVVRPDNSLRKKTRIFFKKDNLVGTLTDKTGYGGWRLRFNRRNNAKFAGILNDLAEVNLPFYIKRKLGSPREYQTIYARIPGSTQCPTAGLHFTDRLLKKIKKKGVDITFIILHIGGSILPLNIKDLRNFNLYEEYFEVNNDACKKINRAKKLGRRIIAIGTTTARALETVADKDRLVCARRGWTDLTIKPGYNFKVMDGFLTNFHLPGSSHLVLTAAFGGIQRVLDSYREAIKKRYKFLDFGDAMFII